jgi:hypothetical protein
MALLTTFATTPIVSFLYPPSYQKKLAAWKRGEIDWDSGEPTNRDSFGPGKPLPRTRVQQLLFYLRLDSMPGLLNVVSLFGTATASGTAADQNSASEKLTAEQSVVPAPVVSQRPVRAHGLRLLQLGDRDSSVMTVSEVEEYTRTDPVVNTFRTVGQIFKVAISGEVATVPDSRFAEALLAKSSDISSDLVMLPWSGTGGLGDAQSYLSESKLSSSYVAFIKSLLSSKNHNLAIIYPQASLLQASSNQAQERLKLTRAYSFSDIHHDITPLPVKNQAHRLILPYIGGHDDRFALMLILQLCENRDATAVVVHIKVDGASNDEGDYIGSILSHLSSDLTDRVEFKTVSATTASEAIVSSAKEAVRDDTKETSFHNVVVLGRRGGVGGGAVAASKVPEELTEALGDSATALIAAKVSAELLVVQAKRD